MPTHDRSPYRRAMTVLILLCLTLAGCWMPTFASGMDSYSRKTDAPKPYDVTGTLAKLDLPNGKGLLRTDEGRSIYLQLRKPEFFQNLSVGDRMTIELNGDGQVDKIMGMSIPDLEITGQPAPPQP